MAQTVKTSDHMRLASSLSTVPTVVDPNPFSTPSGCVGVEDESIFPSIIPPQSPRTLVLCFDGTGDKFDEDVSNVIRLFSMLYKGDLTQQMVYYHSGLGTCTPPLFPTPLKSMTNNIYQNLDKAFALTIRQHILDGYKFLMQYYTEGDRICLFGFSRGAYTVRALAGMLANVGLLQAGNLQQLPFAYELYEQGKDQDCKDFKRAFCSDVGVEFIGVWDTVNSVAPIARKCPPFARSNSIRTFRQAISLDERRAMFQANPWHRLTAGEAAFAADNFNTGVPLRKPHSAQRRAALAELERDWPPRNPNEETNVEDVWFAGCHCDVGGGSVRNDTPHFLARIPLRWMIRECFQTKSGIMFDSEKLGQIGLDPHSVWPKVLDRPPHIAVGNAKILRRRSESPRWKLPALKASKEKASKEKATRTPSNASDDDMFKDEGLFGHVEGAAECKSAGMEEVEELKDALSPIYDQMEMDLMWKLMEWLPLTVRYQKTNDEWKSVTRTNRGKPRIIPAQLATTDRVKVHRSVKMRMDAVHEGAPDKYVPQAIFTNAIWVD